VTDAALGAFAISAVLVFELGDAGLVEDVPSAADLAEPGTTRLLVVFERSAPLLLLGPAFFAAPFVGRVGRALAGFRALFVASGLAFHVALAATTTLGIFPWGLLALHSCSFRGEELSKLRAGRATA